MHSHGASNINYSTVIFIFSLMFAVFHNQSPLLIKQQKTFSVFAQPDDMRRQFNKISANPRRIELNWVKNFPFVPKSKCCFPLLEEVQMNPANLFCFFTNPTRIERFPMTSRRLHLCPKTIELCHVELLTNPVGFDLFCCKRFEFFCSKYICIVVAAWMKTRYLLVGRWLVRMLVK